MEKTTPIRINGGPLNGCHGILSELNGQQVLSVPVKFDGDHADILFNEWKSKGARYYSAEEKMQSDAPYKQKKLRPPPTTWLGRLRYRFREAMWRVKDLD